MSVAVAHPGSARADASVLIVSMLIHAIVALLIAVQWDRDQRDASGASLPSASAPMPRETEKDRKDRLGLTDATSASIDWLGVETPDPVRGEAVESSVNQAAQTPVLGDSVAVSAPEPSPVSPPEPVTAPRPEPKVDDVPMESDAEETRSPPPSASAPDDLAEGDAAPDAVVQEITPETGTPSAEPVEIPEASAPREETNDKGVNEAVVETPSDSVEPTEREPETDATDPSERGEESAQSTNAPATRAPSPTPTNLGLKGIVRDREVAATAIKRSLKIDPTKQHAPVAGEGLEISTVMPRWSSMGRNTGSPRNPVVVIHFDGQGRVAYADFLREPRKVYSSGSVLIDEPLMNAVYRWRAKGKRIDALDPKDRSDTVEVTITFLFNK